jgi:hypothetical protein
VTLSRIPYGSGSLGIAVKNYSIVRIGHEYIVQAGEKSILKVASRRKAAQLVTSAAELLNSQPAPQATPPAEPSIDLDPDGGLPDPEGHSHI